MNKDQLSDSQLDSLLRASVPGIEDNGFSASVMKRIRRRRILAAMIPVTLGSIGALITLAGVSGKGLSSFMLRLADPLFVPSGTDSGGLLMFLASYGIEPSLFWLFLAVPLLIVPFALQQE